MASLDNLFPAIAESFVIILIGYLFGRFKIIDPNESRSITTLVGTLALPALLFRSLLVLDLGQVSWRFLGGLLTSKLIVFVVVVIIALIVSRKFDKAGLYGIFATQSNDFALGLPIVKALYSSDDTFHYTSYIYLAAPISLAIINPVGFFMLEYSKQACRTKVSLKTIPLLLLKTLFYLCINPILFMTLFGVLLNVIMSYGFHKGEWLPSWLDHFLQLLGGAYAPCALFNIGLFMVGKLSKVTGYTLLISTLLILAKSALLPLIGYVIIDAFLPNDIMNTTVENISSFGFLYCTFPTAPTVFVYASQYSVAVPIIASSIVFGTFFSAPIMYISGRMVQVGEPSFSTYEQVIHSTKLNSCSISMCCLMWVFVLFMLSKRYGSYLHVIIMHLMIAQFIECIGGLILELMDVNTYWIYFIFALFFIGVFASRVWLLWLAIGLMVIIKKGMDTANKIWLPMLISSWSVPMIVTVLMVTITGLTHNGGRDVFDTSFMFGTAQLVISALFLVISFSVGTICVIVIIVHLKRTKKSVSESTNLLSQEQTNYDTSMNTEQREVSPMRRDSSPLADDSTLVTGYKLTAGTGTWSKDQSGNSLMRFIVLIVFLLFSCLVGIMVVFWQLVHKAITGTFIAAMVLDNVTNFGQGFFVFVVFGFEAHWFWVAIYKKIKHYLFKIEVVILPDETELCSTTTNLCNTFKRQYLESCKADIASDKRYYFQVYTSVFTGYNLIDWLIQNELVTTRDEGINYGQTLMKGRVLAHVTGEHYFHDEHYYYKFLL